MPKGVDSHEGTRRFIYMERKWWMVGYRWRKKQFILTDKAPEKAKISFEKYLKYFLKKYWQ